MVTEHVLQESTAVPVTSEDGVPLVDSNAVYVAIDPNQPDVQQLLGQIQAITASQAQQGEGEEPRQESEWFAFNVITHSCRWALGRVMPRLVPRGTLGLILVKGHYA